MAELITLARPYAKAAFEYARNAKELDGWHKALSLASLVALDKQVITMLQSPNLTTVDKGDKFVEICGEDISDKQANFIHLLAENDRLLLLPQITELYALYKAEQEKTVDVEVYTAYAISSSLEQKLADTLKEKLDRDVSLITKVDKDLIGGALIRAGDTVLDGSVRGRLAKLAEAMNA
ncbi:F0F1 ATP synthase subunit delta [Teredinibacter sp. KSP-S5-2]|uniref:F0F1 ATP synthase subunit delta n=1 Tax=Teredinibacter sp. KSP-S5-2 TaxID=3034506 RepID=UPI0029352B10|nr:F0F1 ATP synthase subunit delta [Teredinibacter sp. KSP-S5-2]WNO09114.1 F0F1 ATP synthase subunit delta [Teredinibacter sp. KSP-S5-2]